MSDYKRPIYVDFRKKKKYSTGVLRQMVSEDKSIKSYTDFGVKVLTSAIVLFYIFVFAVIIVYLMN
jgi:hypothetical protein